MESSLSGAPTSEIETPSVVSQAQESGIARSAEQKEKDQKNVVYEDNGSTITVQSTKVIGEFNYSFVSMSPK